LGRKICIIFLGKGFIKQPPPSVGSGGASGSVVGNHPATVRPPQGRGPSGGRWSCRAATGRPSGCWTAGPPWIACGRSSWPMALPSTPTGPGPPPAFLPPCPSPWATNPPHLFLLVPSTELCILRFPHIWDLIMQAFQLCMPLIIVHPWPAKRRSFNFAPRIFMGSTKDINFWPKRCPSIMHPLAGEATFLQLCTWKLI